MDNILLGAIKIEIMWQATIKIETEVENIPDMVELNDLKEQTGEYLVLTKTYFDDLLNVIKNQKKYVLGKGIDGVKGPDGEDWTNNPWLFLMVKEREQKTPFWFLIKRQSELDGTLVGIGPQIFTDYITNEAGFDEMKQILQYIIAYPNKFDLIILIPTFYS